MDDQTIPLFKDETLQELKSLQLFGINCSKMANFLSRTCVFTFLSFPAIVIWLHFRPSVICAALRGSLCAVKLMDGLTHDWRCMRPAGKLVGLFHCIFSHTIRCHREKKAVLKLPEQNLLQLVFRSCCWTGEIINLLHKLSYVPVSWLAERGLKQVIKVSTVWMSRIYSLLCKWRNVVV